MKKIFLMVLISVLFTPQTLFAAQSIKIDDVKAEFTFNDEWYVFTESNIVGNTELEELGVTEEDMLPIFEEGNIIVNAALIYEDESYMDVYITYLSFEEGKKLDPDYEYLNAQTLGMDGFKPFMDGYSEERETPYKLYEDDNSVYGILSYQTEDAFITEYVTMVEGNLFAYTIQSPLQLDSENIKAFEDTLADVIYDRTSSEIGNTIYFFVIAGVTIYAAYLQFQTSKLINENEIKPKVFKTVIAWLLIGFQLLAVYGMSIQGTLATYTSIEGTVSIFELWGANIFIIIGFLLIVFNYYEVKKIEKTKETYEQ